MKEILSHLFEGNTLSRQQAKDVLIAVGNGAHSEVEFASLLTVFRMRQITPEELGGFREAMLELCLFTDLSAYNAIDVVGTGGDGKNTFNISTLASFIIAGAGYKVTKHGNYAVTSNSGASNVLEYLGYKFSNDKAKLENDLEKAGICFLHAPLFHPAMKYIAPVRKAMKVKTFFNILGPMINPALPKFQMLGVYNKEVLGLYKEVYKTSGKSYVIITSNDGYDEVSLTDYVIFANNRAEGKLFPGDFGFTKINPGELYGGKNVQEAAKIFTTILSCKGTSAQNTVTIANAALAINCIEPAKSLQECVEIATSSLESRKALQSLKNFVS